MNDDSRIGYANQVYTKELISVLREPIYNCILDIYKKESNLAQNQNSILLDFQKRLKDIPNWNQNIIDENVEKASVKCGFLNDLLAAVYFSNVKILSSVKIKKSKKKVHIKLPDLSDFIHKILIETAKRIYNNPRTFSIKIYKVEMQNKDDVIPLIDEAIQCSIIKILPFQNLLQTYFGNKLHGGESSSDSDSETENSDSESEKGCENDNTSFNEQHDNTQEDNTSNQQMNTKPPQGFFDHPEDENENEIKEVSIGNTNDAPQAPLEDPEIKQKAQFFPDAADDPDE